MSLDRKRAHDVALSLGKQAAAGIARVYAGEFAVEYKEKDDPVTRADREANDFLVAELTKAFPGVPVVAEESEPGAYAGFASKPAAWFVDPLDGTREFVARNGEFCVMIGLAEQGRAILGVIVCPALPGGARTFVGGEGVPAYEIDAGGERRPIHVSAKKDLRGARVLVSRSHLPEAARASMARLGLVTVPCGSAGVKGAKIACGEGDLYAQPGRAGNLWDACAPEAVVRAAGGVWRTFLPRRSRGAAVSVPPLPDYEPKDGYDYARELLANDEGVICGNAALVDAILAAEW